MTLFVLKLPTYWKMHLHLRDPYRKKTPPHPTTPPPPPPPPPPARPRLPRCGHALSTVHKPAIWPEVYETLMAARCWSRQRLDYSHGKRWPFDSFTVIYSRRFVKLIFVTTYTCRCRRRYNISQFWWMFAWMGQWVIWYERSLCASTEQVQITLYARTCRVAYYL